MLRNVMDSKDFGDAGASQPVHIFHHRRGKSEVPEKLHKSEWGRVVFYARASKKYAFVDTVAETQKSGNKLNGT